jgi:hypothetical protein
MRFLAHLAIFAGQNVLLTSLCSRGAEVRESTQKYQVLMLSKKQWLELHLGIFAVVWWRAGLCLCVTCVELAAAA